MRRRVAEILIGCWALLMPYWASAKGSQARAVTADSAHFVTASLLVITPGPDVYSVFGHTALRMECPSKGLDYCFTFETEGGLKGYLSFFAGQSHAGFVPVLTRAYLNNYKEQGRGVRQYELNLTNHEKQELWRALDDDMLAGPRRKFNLLQNNCTSMSVLKVENILDSAYLDVTEWPEPMTWNNGRGIRYLSRRSPWAQFLFMSFVGAEADTYWAQEYRLSPELIIPVLRHANIKKTVSLDVADGTTPSQSGQVATEGQMSLTTTQAAEASGTVKKGSGKTTSRPALVDAGTTLLPQRTVYTSSALTPNIFFGVLLLLTLVVALLPFKHRHHHRHHHHHHTDCLSKSLQEKESPVSLNSQSKGEEVVGQQRISESSDRTRFLSPEEGNRDDSPQQATDGHDDSEQTTDSKVARPHHEVAVGSASRSHRGSSERNSRRRSGHSVRHVYRVLLRHVGRALLLIHFLLSLFLLYVTVGAGLFGVHWNWLLIPFCPVPFIVWLGWRGRKWYPQVYLFYAAVLVSFVVLVPWFTSQLLLAHYLLVAALAVMSITAYRHTAYDNKLKERYAEGHHHHHHHTHVAAHVSHGRVRSVHVRDACATSYAHHASHVHHSLSTHHFPSVHPIRPIPQQTKNTINMKHMFTHLGKYAALFFLAFMPATQAVAGDTDYYAKLTATTSATGKGLVYAATTNTAPTADSQYKASMTVNKGKQTNTQSFTYYAWAKAVRGFQFSGWTGSSATVGSNPTGSGDAITVSGSEDSKNPTDGKVTANWSDATSYTVTYKQPENNGQYSVRYDYTTIANDALTAGSETYTMTTSTADQAVKSYAADQVTLSTSLSSFIGWYEGDTQLSTDKEYTYTVSKDATITAKFTAPKEYQASVTSNGETTQYKTIQEAITAANKLSTTPTVTLLDNITGVDEILTITKSMTLDLNGYTLSGAGGRRAPNSTSDLSKELILLNGNNITVTITDNSTAKTGTINCTDEVNHDLYTIFMNSAGQTLNLDGGTIHCENTMKYVTGTTRMRTKAVWLGNNNRTVNLRGATIEAVADYYSYGILMEGGYNANGPGKVNVSSGKIVATAYNVPTGISVQYADVNVTGGTIEADGTGGTWSSYGITVNAGANAQKKNEWKGTLTMSGGTVKATSATSGARGIRVNRSVAFVNNTQEVGSIKNAEATITGGTITAETTTSWPVGVEPYGDCTISGGTITANATTSDAYGVRVVDGTTHIKDGVNITATAKTGTAIGVASIADTDGSKGTAYEGDLYVEGGTITAKVTSGSNARGIAVYAATRTITSTASGYYAGVYAAAGKATISGGKVSATASGSGANAVYVAATGTLTNATYGTASASPTCSITSGMFIASGTNAASVNSNASAAAFTITGGDYQQNTNLATYIPDTKTVYQITGSIHVDAYNFGCRYYVSDWDNTKAIAKNTSTGTTYKSLKTALDEATSGQTVVLIENYRMEEQATVKSGVTLLIPFNTSNTCYTSGNSKPTTTNSRVTPSAFRTLIMASTASLTVNGSISVSAGMYSSGGSQSGGGAPNGPYGYIKMSEGSTITVNNGGNLYAWGYISGDGHIEANSGANVYEGFQINDFRGGNSSKSTINYNFPFSQYYIQNIECYLTLHYGATEHVYTSLYASSSTNDTNFDLIGSTTGMFRLSSGASLTKHYDAENDRQEYSMTGNAQLNSINMSLAGLTVNSSNYVLPISNNMGITMNGGTLTVNQKAALLPGTQVTINEGAAMTVATNLYVYDQSQWGNYTLKNRSFVPVVYTVAKHKTRTADDLVDAKINVRGTITATANFYTTESGADICSDGYGKVVMSKVPSSATTTWSEQSGSDGRSASSVTINVTSPQLHDADGSYVKTAEASAGTTYYYEPVEGVWSTNVVTPATWDYAVGTLTLTNGAGITPTIVERAKEAKAGGNNVFAVDLSKATNAADKFDVADMRTAIGATDENNVLLYAPATASSDEQNVIVNGTAQSLVITDKQSLYVPTGFTAASITYERANTTNDGDLQWGTVCVPYTLTSGDDIQYYQLSSIEGSTMTFTRVETVDPNQPAVYSVASSVNTLNINGAGTNVAVSATEDKPVTTGDFTLHGVQAETMTLPVSDSSPYYYIARNKFWQPTTNAVTVRPQRAYFQTTDAATAKVFTIVTDEATAINGLETDRNATIEGIYTLGGVKVDKLRRGVNIVRLSNGKTKKVVVR